jgi:hypothetical protein
VFLVQLFVSHPASIYLYNQFQGLRLSGLPLSHQHSYPTLSSALNIFFDGVFLLLLKTAFMIIRLEAGAFKFLRNRLFMTSMQLSRKMSRSLLWCRKNSMRYSAKWLSALATVSYSLKHERHLPVISISTNMWHVKMGNGTKDRNLCGITCGMHFGNNQ